MQVHFFQKNGQNPTLPPGGGGGGRHTPKIRPPGEPPENTRKPRKSPKWPKIIKNWPFWSCRACFGTFYGKVPCVHTFWMGFGASMSLKMMHFSLTKPHFTRVKIKIFACGAQGAWAGRYYPPPPGGGRHPPFSMVQGPTHGYPQKPDPGIFAPICGYVYLKMPFRRVF